VNEVHARRFNAVNMEGVVDKIVFYKMLHWINWIVLLCLEPLAGELKNVSVVWSALAWYGMF
jgi:hypothetical protein